MILVVDDDSSVLDWMSRTVDDEGHRVSAAASVGEALRLAETVQFEVAVVDFRLPDGDGCDLFRRLRLRLPRISGILVTGFATTLVSFECGKVGFSRILEKPIELRNLVDAIDAAFVAETTARDPVHLAICRTFGKGDRSRL